MSVASDLSSQIPSIKKGIPTSCWPDALLAKYPLGFTHETPIMITEEKSSSPPKKCRLLIVDDSEMIRIYFRDIFWIHGLNDRYDIMMADSPEAADKILSDPNQLPDIIFLDLTMPLRSKDGQYYKETPQAGLEILKKIKTSPDLKHIKVIIFSGLPDFKHIVEDLGADGYLVKGDNLPQDVLRYVEELSAKSKSSGHI